MNFARRQQYRRLARASAACAGCAAAAVLGLITLAAGSAPLGGLLLLAAVSLVLYARHWLGLVGRSRVGARSEDEVHRTLAQLEAEGWRLRHSLRWRGQGDIDSIAISPTGVAFAIETKTQAYEERHVARVREQAAWLSRSRRRWCEHGTLPVVCVVRARAVEHVEAGLLVVSIDRLAPALRTSAGLRNRPGFLNHSA